MSEQGEGGGGEKAFDPTPQRLAEARKKGDIPRSADVTAAATYLALLVVVATAGGEALDRAASVLMVFIAHPDRLMGHVLGPGGPGLAGAHPRRGALGPRAGLPRADRRGAPQPLRPAGRHLLRRQAAAEALAPVDPRQRQAQVRPARPRRVRQGARSSSPPSPSRSSSTSARDLDRMVGAATAEPQVIGRMLIESLMVLLVITCLIAVAIAGVDVVWQRFDHMRRLRMSYQDLREETKQSEGDPHMKAQRRSRAEAIATNRMLLDVPKADVVIVNPTHYAVALKWSRTQGSAPVCVAKGEDELALQHPRDRGDRADPGPRGPADGAGAARHRGDRPRDRAPSTTAPSPPRSASPTGCARRRGRGASRDAGGAAPADDAGRGAQGARPRRARPAARRGSPPRGRDRRAPPHRRPRRRGRPSRCRRSGRRCGWSGPTSASARRGCGRQRSPRRSARRAPPPPRASASTEPRDARRARRPRARPRPRRPRRARGAAAGRR